MLKIRRPLGRLIFNMGIAIPGKTVFLIETAPWLLEILLKKVRSGAWILRYHIIVLKCTSKLWHIPGWLHLWKLPVWNSLWSRKRFYLRAIYKCVKWIAACKYMPFSSVRHRAEDIPPNHWMDILLKNFGPYVLAKALVIVTQCVLVTSLNSKCVADSIADS